MQGIRKGDTVIVLTGTNKGDTGQVDRVIYDERRIITHVLVQGLNLKTKNVRPNPARDEPGGQTKREAPIHISNVQLYNQERKKGERVRIKFDESGKRYREFASGGKVAS